VKNVSRQFHGGQTSEGAVDNVKVSNGFKNMIAKIVREFLIALSAKIQVYLDGSPNHQIKYNDIRKIVRLWASLDSHDTLKSQLDAFEATVSKKIQEIASAKGPTPDTQSNHSAH